MIPLKCDECGGRIVPVTGATFVECGQCRNLYVLPKTGDETVIGLFLQADELRHAYEFDKALAVYESILNADPADAAAHWGMALCRYGIEYVEDPQTGQYIPLCHRTQFTPFLSDSDCQAARRHAHKQTRLIGVYDDKVRKINDVQKGIQEILSREHPYDVFICHLEKTPDGGRTSDSVIAQTIYDELKKGGPVKTFFSRVTLKDLPVGENPEPYIFGALNSAKVMLVVATCREHIESVWVKNEWNRFLSLMKKDLSSRRLIVCYRDMNAEDIPAELSGLQAVDMGRTGSEQDVIRGMKKVLDADKVADSENARFSQADSVTNAGDWPAIRGENPKRNQRLRGWMVGGLAAVLVVGLVAVAWRPWSSSPPPPPREVAEWVGTQGAGLRKPDADGNTLAHQAAAQGRVDALTWLKNTRDADFNATNGIGRTPMHLAARDGQSEAMRWLNEQGADMNARDHRGNTPLHLATQFQKAEAVRWLRRQGATLAANYDGETPLDRMLPSQKAEAVRWLKEQEAKVAADMAKNGKVSFPVRETAVDALSDPAALVDVAKSADDSEIRLAAVRRLTDPAALVEVAKNAEDPDVRLVAVGCLKNQPAALVDLAIHADDSDVRHEAVKFLDDPASLADVAIHAKDPSTRREAVEKLQPDHTDESGRPQ